MMLQKGFLRLLVIFLGFSYAICAASAVPTTRTQKFSKQVLPSSVAQDSLMEVMFDVEDQELMERRMDLQINDYGGTGANKDHDPKSPGRA
ncbi:putative Transmembrane protein [Quillaja saponaria]|uniref:Transmembrane protein n=1 Tax=Quillaja saponaria TaxID=32244 RepID=A0AAD7VI74_QUISA|nr:putative Transmembrane protein [Quillaja saponaria]